jgi:hypothetical protein
MEKKEMARNKQRQGRAKKAFLYALGISALGGGIYLTWDYLNKKRNQQQLPEQNSDSNTNNNLPTVTPQTPASKSRKDNFPLKRGSSGSRVTQLQQALDNILGAGSMKKSYGGIDGAFGSGTASALKKAGYPDVIDEETFNRIIYKPEASNTQLPQFDPKSIATTLYRAAQSKSLYTVLTNLKMIKSVSDYSQVNEHYKGIPIISKTIVTDLLDYAFKSDESSKQLVRNEFLRIGLKMNSVTGSWSLQGTGLYKDLVTIRETVVTDMRNNKIPVSENTILGDEIQIENGMTWFRSVDNTVLKVPTQDVKYT